LLLGGHTDKRRQAFYGSVFFDAQLALDLALARRGSFNARMPPPLLTVTGCRPRGTGETHEHLGCVGVSLALFRP
jgi:hypothetical protein